MKQEILSELRQEVYNQQRGTQLPHPDVNTSPFVDAILSTTFPTTFKMPNISLYDGNGDPKEHIALFRAWMDFENVTPLAMCKVFPLTLSGVARTWYASLKPKSISSLPQLFALFETNFASAMVPKQPLSHL